MIKRVAQTAMVLSLTYYTVIFGTLWIGQILGFHNEIWDVFDFPIQDSSPPLSSLIIGLCVTIAGLVCLGLAYLAVWQILEGGQNQDFRLLGKRLQRLGYGLIGFWFSYNLLSGAVQYLIVIGLEDTQGFEMGWDPLDLDIIFLIMAIGILAIAQTLERAWTAEEETKHFL